MPQIPLFSVWRLDRIIEGEDVKNVPQDTRDASTDDSDTSGVDRTNIPKDKILKALARQLYDVLTTIYKKKYEWVDRMEKLKSNGASEEEMEKMQALADDEVENLNTRAGGIEEQMVAIGTSSDVLTQLSEQLVAEVKNLAAKENEKFFQERSKKKIEDLDSKSKEQPDGDDKEKDEKPKDKEEEPDQEKKISQNPGGQKTD